MGRKKRSDNSVARVATAALNGIAAESIWVEAQLQESNHGISLIGLGDSAVREARERVRAALTHCGVKLEKGYLINLVPAALKKGGAGFDVAIAISILVVSGRVPEESVLTSMFLGELTLDGSLQPVRGVVSLVIEAKEKGFDTVFVPYRNYSEAAQVKGIEVVAVPTLPALVHCLVAGMVLESPKVSSASEQSPTVAVNFSEVHGQTVAKRALEVAAAGGHNVLMIGMPGCGKSMMAARFPGILPALTETETLESIRVHSVAGNDLRNLLQKERPFRSPHHSISVAGLIGGSSVPRPGEISLAHHGVLFLDEFPEFRRHSLEALRAPMESGTVLISRAQASYQFPARFQLIAAMNPCPCGRLGSETDPCSCSQTAISRYLSRLSRPILDRIDIHLELDPVPLSVVTSTSSEADSEPSEAIRERVVAARRLQQARQGDANAHISGRHLKEVAALTPSALRLLEKGATLRGLSARGVVRVMRTARTIADLAGEEHTTDVAVAEALSYRSLERLHRSFGVG